MNRCGASRAAAPPSARRCCCASGSRPPRFRNSASAASPAPASTASPASPASAARRSIRSTPTRRRLFTEMIKATVTTTDIAGRVAFDDRAPRDRAARGARGAQPRLLPPAQPRDHPAVHRRGGSLSGFVRGGARHPRNHADRPDRLFRADASRRDHGGRQCRPRRVDLQHAVARLAQAVLRPSGAADQRRDRRPSRSRARYLHASAASSTPTNARRSAAIG